LNFWDKFKVSHGKSFLKAEGVLDLGTSNPKVVFEHFNKTLSELHAEKGALDAKDIKNLVHCLYEAGKFLQETNMEYHPCISPEAIAYLPGGHFKIIEMYNFKWKDFDKAPYQTWTSPEMFKQINKVQSKSTP
jgi:hypothetical protein